MDLVKSILLAGALFLVFWLGRGQISSLMANVRQTETPSAFEILSGEVEAKEGNVVYVDTPEGSRQILIASNAQIYKNNQPVSAEQIQAGNKLTLLNQGNSPVVQLTSSNPVESIQTINWGKWIGLLLFFAIFVGILLFVVTLLRRAQSVEKEDTEKDFHTGGVEASALAVLNSIEKFFQKWSLGLQKLFQGGKTSMEA